MINLPVVQQLSVDGYGMYPGTESVPGLALELSPGLTLILGANGLGKTTLVNILFRMLSGPFDIPNITAGRELGNRRLDAVEQSKLERNIFAARVNDNATDSMASLTYKLGDIQFRVTRRIRDLHLAALEIDGVGVNPLSELKYQELVCLHAKLATFGDWILVLRYLVFYFEDRRALVWDTTAQRELLRLLFLSTNDTRKWNKRTREILELDSLVRNLGYAFRKEQRALAKLESSVNSADEIRQQLKILERVQQDEERRLEALEEELAAIDADRQRARVDALAAEQEYESAMRAVEQHQLSVIATAFPTATETAKYIIGKILAEQECIACGSHVPRYCETLQSRARHHECVVCGTPVDVSIAEAPTVKRLLTEAVKKLESAEVRHRAAAAGRSEAEEAYQNLLSELTTLNSSTSVRSARIGELINMLPPDEQNVHAQQSDLARLHGRYARLGDELNQLRSEFKDFVASVNRKFTEQKEAIKELFDALAHGFLFEECTLIWAPRKARLGESGELIEFAAFELVMSGSDFASPVRRSGPQQVSESQREFIDLAFRMALMSAASDGGGGMLVIDAPESSLDAVFVSRAANVLTRFATRNDANRLVVTSNLVDGDLIPELIRMNGIHSPGSSRVVDLLRIAAPTAATRRLHNDYAAVRQRLFERAKSISND